MSNFKVTLEKMLSFGRTTELTPFKIGQVLHEEDLNLSPEVRLQVVVKIVGRQKGFHLFDFAVINVTNASVCVSSFALKSGYGSVRKSMTTLPARLTKFSGISLGDFVMDYDTHNDEIAMGFRLELSDVVQTSGPSFLDAFRRLRRDETFSDAEVVCRDRRFRVHRVVLSARSDVFATAFASDFVEGRDRLIRIDDVEPDTVDAFIDYVYSNDFDPDKADLTALMELAERYNVESLKTVVDELLIDDLNRRNVQEVFDVAKLYERPNLLLACLKIIA